MEKNTMQGRVVVIGGGVAGMQTAISLKKAGYQPVIVEKEACLGGKLRLWDRLFPSQTPACEVVEALIKQVTQLEITVHANCSVVGMSHLPDRKIAIKLDTNKLLEAEAVVLCSGFDIFDATIKQEYGYGIYENVITSVELEEKLKNHSLTTAQGKTPERIAFLHCVGSRDEQIGQRHCSRVCCITGVKQAIEVRELLPQCEVYNFYMDIRMFGSGFEELYKVSQQKWQVNYVRGRISEASQTMNGQVRIKAEDTLAGRPLKLTVDLLVLLVGKTAPKCNRQFAEELDLNLKESGFFQPEDSFTQGANTKQPNVFLAGTAIAPKSIGEAINDGMAAAENAMSYLKQLHK